MVEYVYSRGYLNVDLLSRPCRDFVVGAFITEKARFPEARMKLLTFDIIIVYGVILSFSFVPLSSVYKPVVGKMFKVNTDSTKPLSKKPLLQSCNTIIS